ncbi:hypothetical protein THIOM_002329 [Candidatus Thiomargarita nelsonii]|uniref:Uncharacterized protein n=1 Tax=Candidatus Thiomargarita nelsonii TaxID=1003181 RepID=A0A176S1E9_9GAMM|nr:hypothetical protein THIOM_002329 [Candidatus Thiomargarita nelsonii]
MRPKILFFQKIGFFWNLYRSLDGLDIKPKNYLMALNVVFGVQDLSWMGTRPR